MANPYDFVPFFKQPPDRRPVPIGHERLGGISGYLECELVTQTPLFTLTYQEKGKEATGLRVFYRPPLEHPERRAKIPGSSLKGVLRSVAEAVSSSCLRVGKPPGGYGKWDGCRETKRACPSCRLFGLLGNEDAYQGRVQIGDAVMVQEGWQTVTVLQPMGGPRPERHWAFYERPKGTPRGRKFYLHGRVVNAATAKHFKRVWDEHREAPTVSLEAVQPGSRFRFRISFWNLFPSDPPGETDDELGLLFYALFLEPERAHIGDETHRGMWHKVGYGKPLGLGSAQIRPLQGAWWAEGPARLWTWDESTLVHELPAPETVEAFAAVHARYYRGTTTPQLEALRRIWTPEWVAPGRLKLHLYPGKRKDKTGWFDLHPGGSLEDYNQDPNTLREERTL